MKVKITSYFTAGILAVASMLTACDRIEAEERLEYVEPTEAQRTVLVEDFTGQRCVNCPNATSVLHEIVETYGQENVIPVAIHCGPFGLTNAQGLVTEAGKSYWDTFFSDTQGQPVAKINRGNKVDDYNTWAVCVSKELSRPTDVTITLTTDYNEETRELIVNTQVLGKAGSEQKLQLWLVEDSIVAIQALPTGGIERQYVHNHVLRDVLNGDWGESIALGENVTTISHNYILDEKFNADNCQIVAFTYDNTGVSQAKKVSVVNNIE